MMKKIIINSNEELEGVMKILDGEKKPDKEFWFGIFHLKNDALDIYIKGVYLRDGTRKFYGSIHQTLDEAKKREEKEEILILATKSAKMKQVVIAPDSFIFENKIRGEFLRIDRKEAVDVLVCI